MARGLTDRQRQVLNFIASFMRDEGYPPTLAEICQEFHLASTNAANDHLAALEKKGYVKRTSGARTLRLTDKWMEEFGEPYGSNGAVDAGALPLVGRVAAGSPIFADENVDGHIVVAADFARKGNFCLRISGDSMIEAGILDGDVVVVDGAVPPREGDIVVALFEDEATVKYFYPHGPMVELRPANRTMQPFLVPAERLTLQGVVVALQRTLR